GPMGEGGGGGQGGSGEAVGLGGRGAGLGGDALLGEGLFTALRHGQQSGPRRGALPEGRAGRGAAAVGRVSASQDDPAEPDGAERGRGGSRGPAPGNERGCLAGVGRPGGSPAGREGGKRSDRGGCRRGRQTEKGGGRTPCRAAAGKVGPGDRGGV